MSIDIRKRKNFTKVIISGFAIDSGRSKPNNTNNFVVFVSQQSTYEFYQELLPQ